MNKLLLSAIFLFSMGAYALGENQKYQMIRYVDSLENFFITSYAMIEWKQERFDWNATNKLKEIKEKIEKNEIKSFTDFHHNLHEFMSSTKDWHVGMQFVRTASSRLHFEVRSSEGRYFIVWIDRKKLPKEVFPYNEGDELISMDGVAIKSIVTELNLNGDKTGETFAEMTLTNRRSNRGDFKLPEGAVHLVFKKKENLFKREFNHTLMWDFEQEQIPNYKSLLEQNNYNYFNGIHERRMYVSDGAFNWSLHAENPYGLGTKKSFIPALGKIIWEAPSDNYYHAYIYKTKSGKKYGYVRIKDYMPLSKEGKTDLDKRKKPYTDLENLMKYFNEFTDGLVIDQVNNPGGDIFYGYFIASMITNKVIETIPEKEILSPSTTLKALANLKELEKIKTQEDVNQKYKDHLLGGLSYNLEHISMLKSYYKNIIEDATSGKKFSRQNYVLGMKYLNPHKDVYYEHPVVVLVNELSISAGDFFPALVQDNQLATIMGVKTSGAGGYVIGMALPNNLGVGSVRITGSIAFRKGMTPIENLGVTPDVEHEFTVTDLTNGYKDYIEKVNRVFAAE